MNEISYCEVCGHSDLSPAINLGPHPLCDDLVAVGDTRNCREYPIQIVYCSNCRTAHQKYQVPKKDLFPATYHYRSRFTADVLNGMNEFVKGCERAVGGLQSKRVVDIGCNDGSLLDFFGERGASTIGVEPTGAATDAKAKGHTVYAEYFTTPVAEKIVAEHGPADIITFTNVFAHIDDLSELLKAVSSLRDDSALVVVENHYLGSVLDGNQFDTFYHEHPRTYSFGSFEFIAASLGLKILDIEFPSRYGGNIRVFMGKTLATPSSQTGLTELAEKEKGFGTRLCQMSGDIVKWKHRKTQQIEALVSEHGPLRAKAFPGRAAILVKLLGLDTSTISAVYEKPGSLKVGNYLPGTRIEIRSDDDLLSQDPSSAPIVNLAWHIPSEIRQYLIDNGCSSPVIDIVSDEDF